MANWFVPYNLGHLECENLHLDNQLLRMFIVKNASALRPRLKNQKFLIII
jgi:hypothetical protein